MIATRTPRPSPASPHCEAGIVVKAVVEAADAAQPHCTVSVPCMPAWRCPGTEQKKLYVPAFKTSVTDFVPPLNVGVAPSFAPPSFPPSHCVPAAPCS